MMQCEEIAEVTVPSALRSVLVEFTVSYLMEQPANIPEFGLSFFSKMVENQKTKIVRDEKAIAEMRELCGDYASSTEGSLGTVEQDVDEDSYIPSLPSLQSMMERQLDEVQDKESLPADYEASVVDEGSAKSVEHLEDDAEEEEVKTSEE